VRAPECGIPDGLKIYLYRELDKIYRFVDADRVPTRRAGSFPRYRPVKPGISAGIWVRK